MRPVIGQRMQGARKLKSGAGVNFGVGDKVDYNFETALGLTMRLTYFVSL